MRDRNREFRRVPLSELMANPANWRRHPDDQRRALRAVLEEIGFVGSLLAFEGPQGLTLIDGHLRQEEIEGLDADFLVPVAVTDLTEEEANKVLVTYDPLGAMATGDKDALASLLISARGQDERLNDLLESVARQNRVVLPLPEGQTDPDDVPPEPEESYVKRGDLWSLGEHRLLCGDAKKDTSDLLGAQVIGLLLADPPYGVDIVRPNRWQSGDKEMTVGGGGLYPERTGMFAAAGQVGGSKPFGSVQRGPRSHNPIVRANTYPVMEGDQEPFDPTPFLGLASVTVLWGANYYAEKLPPSAGWICWDKREGKTTNTFADCELAWTSESRPARVFSHLWSGLYKASERGQRRLHPTQKPVDLFTWLIQEYAPTKGIIYDPFIGSGTTIIAAERLGRCCYAMEIEPKYCQISIERWQKYTGKQAELVERR